MRLTIHSDDFGRMICTVRADDVEVAVTSANLANAADALSKAIEGLAVDGFGECYWPEGVGEYRWVLRRIGEKVRVAVLWSTGTLTGWEHFFWGEDDMGSFISEARDELVRSALSEA